MEDVDSLELSVRLSQLRLSLRIKRPSSLYPDYENEQGLASSVPSAIRVWSDTDSGFASPALLASPPPSPTTPAEDGELHHLMKITAENVERFSVCSPTLPGRRPPLFSVNSQDCSSTCSLVSLNRPATQFAKLSTSQHPTPPLPPRCHQKSSSLPPPRPPKPQRNRHVPRKLL